MQRHSATVESAQGDDGGASIISWVRGSMQRSPSRLSAGRRVESMREPWVPSAPTAPSSMCGFRVFAAVVRHRDAIELIDHDALVSATQIGPVLFVEAGRLLEILFRDVKEHLFPCL
jgi:hypothetical protein